MDERTHARYMSDVAYFLTKMEAEPNSGYFIPLALAYNKLEKYDETIAMCKTAIERYPANCAAKTFLAEAYVYKGQFDEARDLLFDVTAEDDNNYKALKLLGIISKQNEETAEAIKYLTGAYLRSPEDTEIIKMLEELGATIDPNEIYSERVKKDSMMSYEEDEDEDLKTYQAIDQKIRNAEMIMADLVSDKTIMGNKKAEEENSQETSEVKISSDGEGVSDSDIENLLAQAKEQNIDTEVDDFNHFSDNPDDFMPTISQHKEDEVLDRKPIENLDPELASLLNDENNTSTKKVELSDADLSDDDLAALLEQNNDGIDNSVSDDDLNNLVNNNNDDIKEESKSEQDLALDDNLNVEESSEINNDELSDLLNESITSEKDNNELEENNELASLLGEEVKEESDDLASLLNEEVASDNDGNELEEDNELASLLGEEVKEESDDLASLLNEEVASDKDSNELDDNNELASLLGEEAKEESDDLASLLNEEVASDKDSSELDDNNELASLLGEEAKEESDDLASLLNEEVALDKDSNELDDNNELASLLGEEVKEESDDLASLLNEEIASDKDSNKLDDNNELASLLGEEVKEESDDLASLLNEEITSDKDSNEFEDNNELASLLHEEVISDNDDLNDNSELASLLEDDNKEEIESVEDNEYINDEKIEDAVILLNDENLKESSLNIDNLYGQQDELFDENSTDEVNILSIIESDNIEDENINIVDTENEEIVSEEISSLTNGQEETLEDENVVISNESNVEEDGLSVEKNTIHPKSMHEMTLEDIISDDITYEDDYVDDSNLGESAPFTQSNIMDEILDATGMTAEEITEKNPDNFISAKERKLLKLEKMLHNINKG